MGVSEGGRAGLLVRCAFVVILELALIFFHWGGGVNYAHADEKNQTQNKHASRVRRRQQGSDHLALVFCGRFGCVVDHRLVYASRGATTALASLLHLLQRQAGKRGVVLPTFRRPIRRGSFAIHQRTLLLTRPPFLQKPGAVFPSYFGMCRYVSILARSILFCLTLSRKWINRVRGKQHVEFSTASVPSRNIPTINPTLPYAICYPAAHACMAVRLRRPSGPTACRSPEAGAAARRACRRSATTFPS